MVQSVH